MNMGFYMVTRVKSGSDDLDNVGHLGHLFDGSSGSHPQTKLSGCDPDFLVHQVFVRIWQHLLANEPWMNRRFCHEDIGNFV